MRSYDHPAKYVCIGSLLVVSPIANGQTWHRSHRRTARYALETTVVIFIFHSTSKSITYNIILSTKKGDTIIYRAVHRIPTYGCWIGKATDCRKYKAQGNKHLASLASTWGWGNILLSWLSKAMIYKLIPCLSLLMHLHWHRICVPFGGFAYHILYLWENGCGMLMWS